MRAFLITLLVALSPALLAAEEDLDFLKSEFVMPALIQGSAMINVSDGNGANRMCGTGVLLEGGRYLFTNYHVIADSLMSPSLTPTYRITEDWPSNPSIREIDVRFNSRNKVRSVDVAYGETDSRPNQWGARGFMKYVLFSDLKNGDPVYTMGNAGCRPWSFSEGEIVLLYTHGTMADDGIIRDALNNLKHVSPLPQYNDSFYSKLIITTGFLSPGHSGGPVVDRYGRLAGIAFAGGSQFAVVIPVDVFLKEVIAAPRTSEVPSFNNRRVTAPTPTPVASVMFQEVASVEEVPAAPVIERPDEYHPIIQRAINVTVIENRSDFLPAELPFVDALDGHADMGEAKVTWVRLPQDHPPIEGMTIIFEGPAGTDEFKMVKFREEGVAPAQSRAWFEQDTWLVAVPLPVGINASERKIYLY